MISQANENEHANAVRAARRARIRQAVDEAIRKDARRCDASGCEEWAICDAKFCIAHSREATFDPGESRYYEEWLRTIDRKRNLVSANFKDASFRDIHTSAAVISPLSRKYVYRSNFASCVFNEAKIERASFETCVFKGCRFRIVVFRKAIFEDCVIDDAVFEDCIMTSLRFRDVFLSNASFLTRSTFAGSSFENVHFSACDLSGVDFSRSRIAGQVVLDGTCVTQGMKLSRSQMKKISLAGRSLDSVVCKEVGIAITKLNWFELADGVVRRFVPWGQPGHAVKWTEMLQLLVLRPAQVVMILLAILTGSLLLSTLLLLLVSRSEPRLVDAMAFALPLTIVLALSLLPVYLRRVKARAKIFASKLTA